jgi:hypothetical protein
MQQAALRHWTHVLFGREMDLHDEQWQNYLIAEEGMTPRQIDALRVPALIALLRTIALRRRAEQEAPTGVMAAVTDPVPAGAEADTWTFPTGEASYRGSKPFPLTGRYRKLLLRLVAAQGRPVRAADLKTACGNEHLEDSALRGYISGLRAHLREHLDLPPDLDPIPAVDRGGDLAWRLELF